MTNPRTVPEVLRAAADLIAKPGAWTQDAFARTAKGSPIGPEEQPAVCWCASGALMKVCGGHFIKIRADEFLRQVMREQAVSVFNDAPRRTQKQVVAALRQAADLAEAAQQ